MGNPLRTLISASLTVLFSLAACSALHADARFDLAGPRIEVHVTRAGVTLPIAQVPNLQPGDRIWLHPDFPPTQSVHYLMVAVFLRGTTNPPPDNWFNRIETWKPQVRAEGVSIVVPAEAQQVLLFLAPETSGDFTTLRSAVKGRPGIFVRASQDLNAAGFEEARIERYLMAMRSIQSADSKELLERSNLLARTLALKPNPECFKLPIDQQVTCLTQSGNQLLLDDGHGQSIADNLTSGAANDFINASSYTGVAGGGLYSAYVGAIIDLVRLTSTLHTAQYQYIPAIAFPSPKQAANEAANQDELNLRLNAPPSFHNPKSVIVIGLPAIQAASPPPLVAADPSHVACLLKPKLVLGLVGAPLVYSTGFAHDLVLHLNTPTPTPDIPLTPDAFEGGLVVAPKPEREVLPMEGTKAPELSRAASVQQPGQPTPKAAASSAKAEAAGGTASSPTQLTGTVKGMWGFDAYTGPTLPLERLDGTGWRLVSSDPLVAGEDNHLTLAATGVACVESITTEDVTAAGAVGTSAASASAAKASADGAAKKLEWKPVQADGAKPTGPTHEIALTLPLPLPAPEAVHILVHQYGETAPVVLTAKALGEPAKIEGLKLHANDTTATLTGTSLDQVRQVTLGAAVFTPSAAPTQALNTNDGSTATNTGETLVLTEAAGGAPTKFTTGQQLTANIVLKDGRTLTQPVTVAPARPVVTLLSRSVTLPETDPTASHDPSQANAQIEVPADDLPLNARFTFFVKSAENFPRAEHIEIASPDGALDAKLGIAEGTLVLANRHTVLATIDPMKLFGPSAFGPLRLRAIAPDGTAGDWLPLVTVVRLPALTELRCPAQRNAVSQHAHRVAQRESAQPEANPQPCSLVGSNLYLIDSVSASPDFAQATSIPEGSMATTIPLARPVDGMVYLRLRDDPATTDQARMRVVVIPAVALSPETTSGSTPAPKDAQTDTQPATQTDAQPAAAAPQEPAAQGHTDNQPGTQPEAPPAAQSESKPATQPAPQPATPPAPNLR